MSNCPWYIDPMFFDEVTIRPEKPRLITSNYFIPGVLNVITGMSRGDVLGDTCVMNCMAGTNMYSQIETLISDPVYLECVSNSTIASKLSIQYALICLYGIEFDESATINIITSSKIAYDELYYIFEFVKANSSNIQYVLDFQRRLENSEDMIIFNKLRKFKIKPNLIHVKQESNNIGNSLEVFNNVNKYFPQATLFDIVTFEQLLISISQATKSFRYNKSEEIHTLNLW